MGYEIVRRFVMTKRRQTLILLTLAVIVGVLIGLVSAHYLPSPPVWMRHGGALSF